MYLRGSSRLGSFCLGHCSSFRSNWGTCKHDKAETNLFCFRTLAMDGKFLCSYSLSCAWGTSAARDLAKTAIHGFGSYHTSFGNP